MGMDSGYGLVIVVIVIAGIFCLWEDYGKPWLDDRRGYKMPLEQWTATYCAAPDEPARAPELSQQDPPKTYGPPAWPAGSPGSARRRAAPKGHLWAREGTSGSLD